MPCLPIRFHESHLSLSLAAGDAQGVTRTLDLPRALRKAVPQEATSVRALLQRHQACCSWQEARAPIRTHALQVRMEFA